MDAPNSSAITTWRDRWVVAARTLIPSTALLWLVEATDTVFLSDRLETHGIAPRQVDGLEGIVFSPFLHDDWGHLLANTAPFLVLGALVFTAGRRVFWQVSIGAALLGGAATWVLARSGNHIGASLVVFGYLGFLLIDGVIGKSFRSLAVAVVAFLLYRGILWGALPTAGGGVSWEGHLFGLLAGGAVAYLLNREKWAQSREMGR